jgi:hypothetical protein
MPQIRGEESAQPRAARTPRCEPLRRGQLHPVVTQLCRRIRNADLAPTRQSTRHRASALTPRDSAALNDDSGEPEVFLVPVGYWLRDTPHGATIHAPPRPGCGTGTGELAERRLGGSVRAACPAGRMYGQVCPRCVTR